MLYAIVDGNTGRSKITVMDDHMWSSNDPWSLSMINGPGRSALQVTLYVPDAGLYRLIES
jgi:hypothetical protein